MFFSKTFILIVLVMTDGQTIALSAFTDAASNLLDMVSREQRAGINGQRIAHIEYDWPNAKFTEHFIFTGVGQELYGSASFLDSKRGVQKGTLKYNRVELITTSQETSAAMVKKTSVHSYRGTRQAKQLTFVLHTTGGYSEYLPVEFMARKPN